MRQKELVMDFDFNDTGQGNWEQIAQHRAEQDRVARRKAMAWAAAALADEQAVILDTETTGLGEASQVIEVSVIDIHGNVLFDSLCRHCLIGQIPPAASRVHGITDEMLATAPTFPEIYEELKRVLQRASRVIVYNAEYDARLLDQTRQAWGLPEFEVIRFDCAMLPYAAFYGEYNDYHGNYRWQRLTAAAAAFGAETDGAHRALDDARMALEVIRGMAKAGRNGTVQDDQ
jgi:DNA polymerase-3 subunit epsilon